MRPPLEPLEATCQAQAYVVQENANLNLPVGWQAVLDTKLGKNYYWHVTSGEVIEGWVEQGDK